MQSFDPNRDARHDDRDESNRGNNEKRRREVEKKSQAKESDHQRQIDDRRNPVFGAIDATLKAEQQRTKIEIHGSPLKKVMGDYASRGGFDNLPVFDNHREFRQRL